MLTNILDAVHFTTSETNNGLNEMTFDQLCEKISSKKSTELLIDHGNGRLIYSITRPSQKQMETLKTGRFPFVHWDKSHSWEIKEGFEVTGDQKENRLMLIKTGR